MSVRSGLTRLRNSFRRKSGRVSEVNRKNEVSPAPSPKISRSAMSSPRTGRSADRFAQIGDMAEAVALDMKGMLRSDDWDSPEVSRRAHNISGHSMSSHVNISLESSTSHKFPRHNSYPAHSDPQQTSLRHNSYPAHSDPPQTSLRHNSYPAHSDPPQTSLRPSSVPNSSTSLMSSSSSSLTMTNRPSKSGSVVETFEDDLEDDVALPDRRSPPAAVDSDESHDNLPFTDACDAVNLLDTTHDVSFKDAEDTVESYSGAWASDGDVHSGETLASSKLPGEDVVFKSRSSNPDRVSFGANLQEVLGRAEEAGDLTSSHRSEVTADTSRKVGLASKPAGSVVLSDSGEFGDSRTISSIAAAACVIPQSLKASPSSSLLGFHRDPAEDITCRVCSQHLTKPRILPCLHTFCAACISSLQTYPVNTPDDTPTTARKGANSGGSTDSPNLEQGSSSSTSTFSQVSGGSQKSSDDSAQTEDDRTRRRDGKRVVLCPICLKETRVSHTLEELPRNFVAERRVAQNVLAREGRGVRLECDSCAEFSDAAVVSVRCMDCAENLCSLCELSHRRQRKTKRHQLVDLTQKSSAPDNPHCSQRRPSAGAMSESVMALSVAPPRSIRCNRHSDEELRLFCVSCDVPVCRDCVVVEHRDHDCQFLCQELFRHQMNEVQQMIRSVVPRITAVDHQLKKVAESQAAIQARADDVTREITGHMDAYLSAIQRHRQHLLQQVVAVVEEKQHALHVTERHLRHVRSDVEQTCRFVSDMVENATDVEILSVKHLVTDRLTGLKELTTTQHQPVSAFIKFCPAEKGEVINHFQMFGRVVSRKASAAASVLFTEGLSTARVGHESSVILRVNSEDGAHYNEKDVKVKAWLIFQNQSIRSIPVGLSVQKNGTHCLRFSPLQPGSHFLHVAVDSHPVKDSPFKFKVKPQWREHKGLWHCCTSCSSSGRNDVPCGCRGAMPGGLSQGCAHGQPGHPGGYHWSCCGKMVQTSECAGVPMPRQSPVRQVTL